MPQGGGRLATLSLLVCIGAPALIAQTQTPPPPPQTRPTFRTATDVVPLTVTVLDKAGNPVTDLKASDFTVIENKEPREILSFFTQTLEPAPAAALAKPAALNRKLPKQGALPETRRTFLLVLGYGRIQYPTRAVDALIEFVKTRLLPQDMVGVLAFDRVTDFTTDRDEIVKMLERFRQEHERIVFDYNEFLIRKYTRDGQIPPAIRDDIDAVFTGVPTPRVKKLGSNWSSTGRPIGSMRETIPILVAIDYLPQSARTASTSGPTMQDFEREAVYRHQDLTRALITNSVAKGYVGIEYLRYLEGDKRMVYLGDDGLVPAAGPRGETDKRDDAKFARRLNDARVTLDMIRTSGPPLTGLGPWQYSLDDLVKILGFQYVAEINGGSYTGVSYANKALDGVDRASRFGYVLGYAPVNPALDGLYRNVEVKVNRKDVILRYRHGYFASEQPDKITLGELLSTARVESATQAPRDIREIRIDATATVMPRLGIVNQLAVDIRIDTTRLMLPATGSESAAKIQLHVYVGDDKQFPIGESSEELEIAVPDEASRTRMLQDGISRRVRLALSGVPKYVKVIVFDPAADLVGTAVITLK